MRSVEELCTQIVLACQGNAWLRDNSHADAFDCSSKPSDYSFFIASDNEELRAFFRKGQHRLREVAILGDLAFVQQVDMGDEWWTLRAAAPANSRFMEWTPIESLTLSKSAEDPDAFCALIDHLNKGFCSIITYELRARQD